MKTKLLLLTLLAGGSMFAQTQFSIGITTGGNNRGYYAQTPPYAYAQPYGGYTTQPSYEQPSYNNRYDNGYATQDYTHGRDVYDRRPTDGTTTVMTTIAMNDVVTIAAKTIVNKTVTAMDSETANLPQP